MRKVELRKKQRERKTDRYPHVSTSRQQRGSPKRASFKCKVESYSAL